jgi:hypothetical protein
MQQFALTSISPRTIAWLMRDGELERLEQIIFYNSAMMGGYFNIFIPLTEQDGISEEYQRFLIDYDPDFVVLPPHAESINISELSRLLHPFALVFWEHIAGIVMLDPWSSGTGRSVTVGRQPPSQKGLLAGTYAAVADEMKPSESLLALVACGDVVPREPMWNVMDNNAYLSATGHRETFLSPLLRAGYPPDSAQAHVDSDENVIPAPDRYQLQKCIAEEYQFPLNDSVKILTVCCSLQTTYMYNSFIGLTAKHQKWGSVERTYEHRGRNTPAVVILVTDEFHFHDALLFWNLRASGFIVTWISYAGLQSNTAEVVSWLESDYQGIYYAYMIGKGGDVVFACQDEKQSQLQEIVDTLYKQKKDSKRRNWRVEPFSYFIFYDYIRPSLQEDRVLMLEQGTKYSFLPKLPDNSFSGEYTLKLEWSGLMMPRNKRLIQEEVSNEVLQTFYLGQTSLEASPPIPRFRMAKDRFLKMQIGQEKPIMFNKPSFERVVDRLFYDGGFHQIEQSNTAKYHANFIRRAGDLEKAANYLANSPFRDLLTLLADNRSKNQRGWIIAEPSKRRVLNHLHLYQSLGRRMPTETVEYFNTVSDKLPEEVVDLLKKELLERGVLLKCLSCGYLSWYPVQSVGQGFQCSRCFETQVYESNPLWLYKLPEVIFQGFEDNMQVPLLTLHYLKQTSKHSFEWLPDSNVFWSEKGKQVSGNIDVICLRDGKFYVGEAKSNDNIDREQFSFYERICKSVDIDGVVFATSQIAWSKGTQDRIKILKTWFKGDIVILAKKELYPTPHSDTI